VDNETFPAVELARHAGATGGCLPAIYNAANEEALAAFVAANAAFTDIVDTVAHVLDDADDWRTAPGSVAEVLDAERWARAKAHEHLAKAGKD
jgi:1-deoxy-D-xylulose-5-phosphate reductoisomerase